MRKVMDCFQTLEKRVCLGVLWPAVLQGVLQGNCFCPRKTTEPAGQIKTVSLALVREGVVLAFLSTPDCLPFSS